MQPPNGFGQIEPPMPAFGMPGMAEMLAPEGGMDVMLEQENADGSVTYEFDEQPKPEPQFGDNLANFMEKSDLEALGAELLQLYKGDKMSRADWEKQISDGFEALGFTYEERKQPFDGAFGARHPILAEAVVRFQAHALAETFPATGPVKTEIIGEETPDRMAQAERKKIDMNYWLTTKMPEYRSEHAMMLFAAGLYGSAFKKVWRDQSFGRPMSRFVPAEDLVLSYGSSDLMTCDRVTHVLPGKTHSELRKLQVSGFYRDVDVPMSSYMGDAGPVKGKIDEIHGQTPNQMDDAPHIPLEMHVAWNLKGFEDKYVNEEGELQDSGIALPYVITLDEQSGVVLGIRRNWLPDDPLKRKRQHFVHYRYIFGPGPYGIGLIQLIGGLTRSATTILRNLVDAGTFANMQGGHYNKGTIQEFDSSPLAPGEWRGIKTTLAGTLAQNMVPLNYKEPSAVLFQLLGVVVDEARLLGGIADTNVSEIKQETPVGTTLAIIERTLKVISTVHAGLHASQREEFALLVPLIRDHSPEYDYDPVGGVPRGIKQQDYDDRIDVLPVSDPNASSMAHRVALIQTIFQLVAMAPQVYDMKYVHRAALQALGIQDYRKMVPLEEDMEPLDPISENTAILSGKPVKVFPHQDHWGHIQAHKNPAKDPRVMELLADSPMAGQIQGAMAAHIAEHVGHWYRTETERHLGSPLPADGKPMPPEVERELTPGIAMATQRVLEDGLREAQAKKNQAAEQDPVIQLQRAELELKGMTIKQRDASDQRKIDLEREKILVKERIEKLRIASQSRTAAEQTDAQREIAGAKIGLEGATAALEAEIRREEIQESKSDDGPGN